MCGGCAVAFFSIRCGAFVTWAQGIVIPASTQSVRDRMDCDPTECRRRVCCFEGGLRCSEDSEDLCEMVWLISLVDHWITRATDSCKR